MGVAPRAYASHRCSRARRLKTPITSHHFPIRVAGLGRAAGHLWLLLQARAGSRSGPNAGAPAARVRRGRYATRHKIIATCG